MQKAVIILVLQVVMLFGKPYTDMLNRVVEIPKIETIVCIGPGALRLATYLGLHERLVGIEKTENSATLLLPYRTFLGKEKIAKLPIIGEGGAGKLPDFEALLLLKPDFIIASFMDKSQMDLITQKTGIPVLSLSYRASYGGTKAQLESIKNSLLLLGTVTNTLAKAENLVTFMNHQEAKLLALKIPRKKVYIAGIGYKGVQGLLSTEANYLPFELLGIKNSVFENTQTIGHHFIDLESLLKSNPEIIFIDRFGKVKVNAEYLSQKAIYDSIDAYEKSNIKEVLNYNFYSINVENIFVIAWQIASYMGEKTNINTEIDSVFKAFYEEDGLNLLQTLNINSAFK